MSSPSWDDMNRQWRELYDQQAKVAQGWLDGQAQLASTLAGAGSSGDSPARTAADDAAALAELWRSWMALGSLGGSLPGMQAGGTANETLGKMLDPVSLSLMGGNQVGEAIRRMTEGPRFADLGVIERRMARVMELYLAVQTSARKYEAVIAGAWSEANQRFAAQVAERFAKPREEALPAGGYLRLWLDIANDVLVQTHRTEGFLQAQRQLLRDGMEFLLAEREMVEQLVEPAGLPTRSEIDELHQSVQVLKRKVRALEKSKARTEP